MPTGNPKSPGAIENLLSILDLEPLEDNLFRGRSPQQSWQRVFGGQTLGQALVAAVRTVPPERIAHSLHAYFLQPGDLTRPIIYGVERVRDGGSFTTRRVTATQHGRAMFVMSVSFHKSEPGLDHQNGMPDVPSPEDLPSEGDLKARLIAELPEAMRTYWERERPIEMRPVDVSRYFAREKRAPVQYVWMRASGPLPDDAPLHQCVLAYASDFSLLDTALLAHGKLMFDQDIQLASLDHALWFHRPFRADEWLLYAQDSPSSHGGGSAGAAFSRATACWWRRSSRKVWCGSGHLPSCPNSGHLLILAHFLCTSRCPARQAISDRSPSDFKAIDDPTESGTPFDS